MTGLEELLRWYADAGADEALGATPVDRFQQSEALAAERAARRETAARVPPAAVLPTARTGVPPSPRVMAPDAAAREATEMAAACADLDALEAAMKAFEGCDLRRTARSTLWAIGRADAPLVVVGDVPDRHEDAQGEPFAGPAGAMLDRMLGAIGLERGDVRLVNASPWRTPGQRQLTPGEKAMLAPILARHLALCEAPLVLAMGGAATELVFGSGKRLPALRGRWSALELAERTVRATATFHPNFLMRQPEQKARAWADLLVVKEAFTTVASEGSRRRNPSSPSPPREG